MARKAVAATLASIILFSSLVIADATLMSAHDNLASSAQVSRVEFRESVMGTSLLGTTSLGLLASVEDYLSSNPADCASLPQYLAALSSSTSRAGADSGIAYSVNASIYPTPSPPPARGAAAARQDNLTIISPFSGFLPGALNLQTTTRLREVGGSVSLDRNEVHLVHLAISPESAASLCSSTLSSLAVALSQSCNATIVQAAFNAVMPQLVWQALGSGFVLNAGFKIGSGCSVTYWITLVELEVEGVTGSFDWVVQGSGSTAVTWAA